MDHASARLRIILICALVAVITLLGACDDSPVTQPRSGLRPVGLSKTEELFYDDYAPADSSPNACAAMDCVSLTADEKQEFLDMADYAIQQAGINGDYECWALWKDAWSKVNTNFVFNMRANVHVDGGNANGAYNYGHGDAYIKMSNFPSEASAMETLAHETAHYEGYHDAGYTTETWYAQDQARVCSIYTMGG